MKLELEEDKYHLRINALKTKLEESIRLLEEIINETGHEIKLQVNNEKIIIESEREVNIVTRQQNIEYNHSRIKIANMVFYG